MFKVAVPAGVRKLAVPFLFATAALAPFAASPAASFAACTSSATTVCTPSGGVSQYDIAGVTSDQAATIQSNGSQVGGVFAEGTALMIMLKLVKKPRTAV